MDIDFKNLLEVDEATQELVRTWRNLDDVRKFMIHDHIISLDEHKRWIEKIKVGNTKKAWVIYYNKKPVGLMYLSNIDWTKKITDWGLYIAEKNVRGKGIGSEALSNLIKRVFDDMKFNMMKTFVLDNNDIAIKLYEKIGFKKKGNVKHKIIRDNREINVYLMILKKQDFIQNL